jgi:hypothetical protein
MHGVLKKLLIVLLLLSGTCAVAQPDSMGIIKMEKTPPAFGALLQAGLLAGGSGRYMQVQTAAGLQYKTWFVGAGAGIDYYYLRSIPVFVSARKLFQNRIPLFLYADAGWNIPWVKKDKTITWYTSDFKSGLYYDGGLGWQVKLSKRHALSLSAGYSGKKIREARATLYDTTQLVYSLRRYSFKIGFQL